MQPLHLPTCAKVPASREAISKEDLHGKKTHGQNTWKFTAFTVVPEYEYNKIIQNITKYAKIISIEFVAFSKNTAVFTTCGIKASAIHQQWRSACPRIDLLETSDSHADSNLWSIHVAVSSKPMESPVVHIKIAGIYGCE